MGPAVQPAPFYGGRTEYIPLPRPTGTGALPVGPNTLADWPCHRLVYELGWSYEQVDAATIADILDANEAIDVMYDVTHPPAPPTTARE